MFLTFILKASIVLVSCIFPHALSTVVTVVSNIFKARFLLCSMHFDVIFRKISTFVLN